MRKCAQDYLPTMASQTSERIQDVLQHRATALSQLDRYCRIESLFLAAHIGPAAETRMHQVILDCLPQKPDNRSMGECLTLLQKIGDGRLHAFCGAGLQAAYSTIRSFLMTLSEGRSPLGTKRRSPSSSRMSSQPSRTS